MLPCLISVTTSHTHRKGKQEVICFLLMSFLLMSRFGEDAEFSLSCIESAVPMQYPQRDSEGLEVNSEMPQRALGWSW